MLWVIGVKWQSYFPLQLPAPHLRTVSLQHLGQSPGTAQALSAGVVPAFTPLSCWMQTLWKPQGSPNSWERPSLTSRIRNLYLHKLILAPFLSLTLFAGKLYLLWISPPFIFSYCILKILNDMLTEWTFSPQNLWLLTLECFSMTIISFPLYFCLFSFSII